MILMYHKVAPTTPSIWWVSADTFNRQLAALQAYDVVYLDEYDPKNPRQAVITFDGVYKNVLEYAAPLLQKWGYPFELFVIGERLGKSNEFDQSVEPPADFANLDELRELVRMGGRIQWHSRTHRELRGLPASSLDEELTPSRSLADQFPAPHLRWFAYPHGQYDDALLEGVRRKFVGAVACNEEASEDRYLLPRVTVTEATNLSSTKVSIVIANYNYGRFLPEAIDSVLSQSIPPDELIVIDDCSTDNSRFVLDAYRSRIRIIENERNLGIVENFRKAVSLTTGDYVGFLGADNRMRSDYVEQCKAALDRNPDAAVAYTDMVIFGALAPVLAQKVGAPPVHQSPLTGQQSFLWKFPDPPADMLDRLKERNFIHGSSMYRRAAYDQVGGYRVSSGPEDHDLFVRMIAEGWRAVHVGEPLIEYRQHSPTQANTALSLQLQVVELTRELNGLRRSTEQRIASIQEELTRTHQNWERRGEEIERLLELQKRLETQISETSEHWQQRGEEIERLSAVEIELRGALEEARSRLSHWEEENQNLHRDVEQLTLHNQALQAEVEHMEGLLAERTQLSSGLPVSLEESHEAQAALQSTSHGIASTVAAMMRSIWRLSGYAVRSMQFLWASVTRPSRGSWATIRSLLNYRRLLAHEKLLLQSGLFDQQFYLDQVGPGGCGPLRPTLHFLLVGGVRGFSPHCLFDTRYYQDRNPDVREIGVNPFVHYLSWGWREGRSPHRLFDVPFYFQQGAPLEEEPIGHFLRSAPGSFRHPNRLFDPEYYLSEYEDVRSCGMNPLVHFLRWGAGEGRRCHPMFDAGFYLAMHPDVCDSNWNPLEHYFAHGLEEGRATTPMVVPDLYLQETPPTPRQKVVSSRRPAVKTVALFVVYGEGNVPFLRNVLIPTVAGQRNERRVELHLVNYRDRTAHFPERAQHGSLLVHDWSGVRDGRHIGFGEGHNFLFERVQPSDCFTIVNPDSTPLPGCLDNLYSTYERTSAGIVEASQWPRPHPKEFDLVTGDTPWASGAFSLIDSAGFAEIGGFDPVYFLYGEDVDLSWRVWLSGRRVVHEPLALCGHFTGLFTYRSDRFYYEHFYSTRNFLALAFKFFGERGESYGLRVLRGCGYPADFKEKVISSYFEMKPSIQRVSSGAHPAVKILNMNVYHLLQPASPKAAAQQPEATAPETLAHAG